MKSFVITSFLLFSFNLFAREFASSADTFMVNSKDLNALIASSKVQCGTKFKDYNFEQEFKLLFNYSYSNRNVSKIKKMSLEIEKELQTFCDKNHYLASGFRTQHCHETCLKHYPKDELLREQCQATCTSVEIKINSLTKDLATLVDEDIVETEKCSTGSVRVDDTSRGKAKENQQTHGTVGPVDHEMVIPK